MNVPPAVDWSIIDTVLLDMDGTLLDLRYDNWFWLELIPLRYARAHGLDEAEARRRLAPKFAAVRGTLEWYCIDYWSEQLELDIAALKRENLSQVAFLPGAVEFLGKLRASGKRAVLVTNAHPATLELKDRRVGLNGHFDACHSSHRFAFPKEHEAFWPLLTERERFDPARTLFVDDSLSVLKAARHFGIAWLRAVRHPDSGLPAQDTGDFLGVDRVSDLM